jgi:hypothetical protein
LPPANAAKTGEARRATSRRGLAAALGALPGVTLVALLGGCASSPIDSARAFASVTPLPPVVAQHGQSSRDQEWDVRDCQAEAGYKTNYSPSDSPLGNLFQKLFFWGTAGAALGGTVDGFPTFVTSSEASTGLIVGASTGGAVGAASSWHGGTPYERAWAACIESRGYAIVPTGSAPPAPTAAPRPVESAEPVKK